MNELKARSWDAASAVGHQAPVSRAPLSRTVRELMGRGDRELLSARRASDVVDQFTHAHLAALRFAGAVIGAQHPGGRSARGRSAWQLLAVAEPAMASWAAFFSAGAPLRAALEAGRFDAVRPAEAQEWIAAAQTFADDVWSLLIDGDAADGLLMLPTAGAVARAS